ncbi:hypothetical protein [Bacillus albus]|uniref:hypothetical protein n=1 Tax=Bacillus albus TaxID=2026189 RepID=UPI001021FEF2|nr:hypothetical protein [Bacillus albus]
MIGYEQGAKATVMIMGDMMFSSDLMEAGFLGIAYIKIPKHILEGNCVEIALVFEDKVKGKKAFSNLLSWVEGSNWDGDALEMDFVESKENGYTLCMYQNIDKLLGRCVKKSLLKWINPLVSLATHFKRIDNVSPQYKEFKKAMSFCKVKVSAIDTLGNFILEDKYILKSNVNFYTEDNIPDDAYIKTHFDKGNPGSMSEFTPPSVLELDGDINSNRISKIKNFLPITYEKIIRNEHLKSIIQRLNEEYSSAQVIQAICNIVLMERLHIEGKTDIIGDKENIHMNILYYLDENPEEFNSYFPNFNELTLKQIQKQIQLDIEDYESFKEEQNGTNNNSCI